MAGTATVMGILKRDGLPELLRNLKRLEMKTVLVGVPADESERKEVSQDEMNNATLLYIHEHGSPLNNIPARPSLDPGIKNGKDRIIKYFRKAAEDMLISGDQRKVDQSLHSAGMVAQNSIRAVINSGVPPELAESTLAARRRRGRTGTKPLIDTGQLRNSITYVLEEKKK